MKLVHSLFISILLYACEGDLDNKVREKNTDLSDEMLPKVTEYFVQRKILT